RSARTRKARGDGSRAGAASFAPAPHGAGAAQVHRRRASCRETPVVEAGVVALKRALGAIARAHERSGDAFEEAERERALAIAIELLGSHEAPDGQVITVGRRYCPRVTMSTPAVRRSASV